MKHPAVSLSGTQNRPKEALISSHKGQRNFKRYSARRIQQAVHTDAGGNIPILPLISSPTHETCKRARREAVPTRKKRRPLFLSGPRQARAHRDFPPTAVQRPSYLNSSSAYVFPLASAIAWLPVAPPTPTIANMIDPVTAANVAVEAVGVCVKAVKLIKRAIETMKQAREGLLNLVNRAERMRTILDLLRVLCNELKGTPHEGQEFIPLNRDQCLQTMRELEGLANNIAGVWTKNKAFAGIHWLWYKTRAEGLVQKLHDQEADIANLLTIIGT